ncbi:unnamed protein product [Diatraea saccharalis]|uniref:Uncharacterized protein n=1 Tax=Diatraea saccharalis TaxID=40085 RepID=A0A9P0CC97_9NEOP|nr:unnamed protein product [Diatraea saccharalis]
MDKYDEDPSEVATPPTPEEYMKSSNFDYTFKKRKNKKGKYYRSNIRKNIRDVTCNSNNDEAKEDIEEPPDSKDAYCDAEDNNHMTEEHNDDNDRTDIDSQPLSPSELPETAAKLESEHISAETKDITESIDENILPPLINVIKTRPLSKHSNTYELEKFEKKALFIFKHQDINGFKANLSIDKDEKELTMTFSEFGFEIKVEKDLTKVDLMKKLKEYSGQDFTEYGCVAVAILTYGEKHGLIWAKDELYNELELIKYFKNDRNPALITKPKIFIIQAGVGQIEETKGVIKFRSALGSVRKDFDEDIEPYTLPVESDLIIFHNSYSGKQSTDRKGSWFIETLCSTINQMAAEHDLLAIFTKVKREVISEENNEDLVDIDRPKLKMPVTTSTLIRKLYLRRFDKEQLTPVVESQADFSPEAKDTVLDNSETLKTQLSYVHNKACSCFLEHFEYMTESMKHYLDDHSDDDHARSLYDVAITFKEGAEFNTAKERMLQVISNYLTGKVDLKYLHVYTKKIT